MKKEIRITKKGAAKKVAEIFKQIREQPISQRMYDFVEAYKKEQRQSSHIKPLRARSDEKSF